MIRAAAVRDSIAKLLYYRLGASQAGDWVVGGGFDSSPPVSINQQVAQGTRQVYTEDGKHPKFSVY